MKEIPLYQARFEAFRACVLIPTYNNESTLANLISDTTLYTSNIIVVNDGSTDGTAGILEGFPSLEVFTHLHNKGKGLALRDGFAYALKKGYRYAISIDSDGQHFPKDLGQFLDKAEETPDAIIIGARNMNQSSVPGKSSFGHKFSNFWFWVETGIKAPDTQSGYRLYPLQLLAPLHLITRKFEFEIEVLVRAAWKGIKIESVPVTVYYAPKETRVSHFRPFKDFTRISILNTVLVIITIFYIIPRNFIRKLTDKKKRQELWQELIVNPGMTDERKAASIAFGVFMGIVPIWGFQLLLAIFLSILLKLNKALVIIAANISIPPLIPFIIYLSYNMGAFWLGAKAVDFTFSKNSNLHDIRENLRQYLYGSITLAVSAALVFGITSYLLLKIFKHKKAIPA
jgi:glycosyltransferase involved in cell wall biosynthesis